MQPSAIEPVIVKERIQSIDIIRGIALLGILIINFTADDNDAGIYDGFNGVADQAVYWTIKVFLDDRFQTIYCFLFGLGFAIQLQRAAEKNKTFVFAFIRRMIVLYMFGIIFTILAGGNVFMDYATVGVILLLFWKVPAKFLPWLAILSFLLPLTRNGFVVKQTLGKKEIARRVALDTASFNKCLGVFNVGLPLASVMERCVIVRRDGNSLLLDFPFGHDGVTYPISQTEFFDSAFIARFRFWMSRTAGLANFPFILTNAILQVKEWTLTRQKQEKYKRNKRHYQIIIKRSAMPNM